MNDEKVSTLQLNDERYEATEKGKKTFFSASY